MFFGVLFVLFLAGQSVAGAVEFNNQQAAQGREAVSYLHYLTTSDFAVDVAENWQSEFLQFFLYVFATVWLVQRGSTESKELDQVGRESDQEQRIGRYAPPDAPRWARAGGIRLAVYSRSLGLAMCTIFFCRGWRSRSPGPRPTTLNSWANSRTQSAGPVTSRPPTSGAAVCRTGNLSSWRWPRWRPCRSICVSAGPRNPSRSAQRTRPPATRAEP